MLTLQEKIDAAAELKPEFGDDCNHCGWCCLTEVCPIGQVVTGTSMVPCSMLVEIEGQYFCSLANTADRKRLLGIGAGCCAITVQEKLNTLLKSLEALEEHEQL